MKTETDIIQENVLIAEFMGYEIGNYLNQGKLIYTKHKSLKTVGEHIKLWQGLEIQFIGRFIEYVKFPFNSNWNYLMPIIHQIECLGYVVNISGISCKIYPILDHKNPIVSWVLGDKSNKIELVYTTVIEFIKIYNEKKHNT